MKRLAETSSRWLTPRRLASCGLASTLPALVLAIVVTAVASAEVSVRPLEVVLDNPEASQQLLVSQRDSSATAGPDSRDLTRAAVYRSLDPKIAAVGKSGQVVPRGEGQTKIEIEAGGQRLTVAVTVRGQQQPPPVSFQHQIVPILTKSGCNSGGCHGKAEGQNGFKLSVFGFDAQSDYDALVKESRGRRIYPASPEHSLLIRKATAVTPHGGGQKIIPGSLWYQRMVRWVREGASFAVEDEPAVERVEVYPAQVTLGALDQQQLQVTAIDPQGKRRCVTVEAEFQSNAETIASVDRSGRITASDIPGEAAILVRFMEHVAICRVTLPQPPDPKQPFERPQEQNFVDRLVWNKLQHLGIQPSPPADDATFLRRVYLDVIGTLPSGEEAREFLADSDPDKRQKLVDRLLERDEYADYWALRWADILRVDRERVTPQGTVAMTRWLRDQLQQNQPYDQFVRQIVTAKGNVLSESPASFYQVHKEPESIARSVSQVFLGVRIECAQCHHHPFERWSQADYFAFSGLFTGLSLKPVATGGGKKLVADGGKDLSHPRTGELVPAAPLGAAPLTEDQATDRRQALAQWMTDPANPFLARMLANRLWAHYFGRGLVEPIDDMRATNPASNEPLLQELARHLVDVKFDVKTFTRTLLLSNTYQLQSQANGSNERDKQNFSHYAWKPLPAEVLLDAMCQVTDIPEPFNGWPLGYRAIEVWDNRTPSYFFRVFGKPQRVSVCECERGNEPSIAQALHLMNSPESVRKIRHRDGRAARLADSQRTPAEIIETLYLATLARQPSAEEAALMLAAFEEPGATRRQATEDVLWVLLNTREFVYNH